MRRARKESSPLDNQFAVYSPMAFSSSTPLIFPLDAGCLFEREAYRRPGVLRRLFATHAIPPQCSFQLRISSPIFLFSSVEMAGLKLQRCTPLRVIAFRCRLALFDMRSGGSLSFLFLGAT